MWSRVQHLTSMVFKTNKHKFYPDVLSGICLQVILSLSVSLTTMSDGLSVGWSAAKIADLTDSNHNSTTKISLEQASFIGTLATYVSPIVMPFAIFSSNHLGRKWTIIWAGTLLFTSWIILIFVNALEYIYVAVVLRGIGGFIFYTVPQMYIAEISQANIRGFLSTFVPSFMNLGILLSYVFVTCTSLQNLAIFGAIKIALMFPLFILAPESPYFLFMKNKPEKAEISLHKLRNTKNIREELNDIKMNVEKNSRENSSIKEFFTDKICRKVTIIVLATQLFQQLSGIDAILLFLQLILSSSNSYLSGNYSSIVFGVAKFTACGTSLLLIDRIGRRTLLIFSSAVASCALAIMGFYFYVRDVCQYDTSSISWLPLLILIVYILGYNIGLGTVPSILASEMYPTKFKALGVAACQVVYCISMVSVAEIFALIKDHYGFYLSFWFLSAMSIVGLVFCIYCVRETKGKTLKQILIELE